MTSDAPPGRHTVDPSTGPTVPPDDGRPDEQADGGGGAAEVTLHEERLATGTEPQESGRVRVSKRVETYPVEQVVPRSAEHADTSERQPAVEGDDGEVRTLADGSISIPVFEEVLVVTKRLVVRERVIVRKQTVAEEQVLRTELRREHVEVSADDGVELEDRRTT